VRRQEHIIMALQPSNRPAGSSQVLRFSGTVSTGPAIAVFPKANGEFSSDTATVGGQAYHELRLALADVTALDDTRRRLPDFDFDDSNPAGISPHAATPGLGVNVDGLVPTEQNISVRTWCQNTYVTVQPLTAVAAAALLAGNPVLTRVVIDAPDSGLGGTSGVPVLVLFLQFAGQPPASVDLDILVEIRHSASH
jgi:hypothetical protein